MKNITKLLSILIIGMGVSTTSFANSPFSSGENFGGTVFDPLGSRHCYYEIYCDGTGRSEDIDNIDRFNYRQLSQHFPEDYPRIQY